LLPRIAARGALQLAGEARLSLLALSSFANAAVFGRSSTARTRVLGRAPRGGTAWRNVSAGLEATASKTACESWQSDALPSGHLSRPWARPREPISLRKRADNLSAPRSRGLKGVRRRSCNNYDMLATLQGVRTYIRGRHIRPVLSRSDRVEDDAPHRAFAPSVPLKNDGRALKRRQQRSSAESTIPASPKHCTIRATISGGALVGVLLLMLFASQGQFAGGGRPQSHTAEWGPQ
jgi:hypothetical protein